MGIESHTTLRTKYGYYKTMQKSTASESLQGHACHWTFVHCYVHVLCTKLKTYVVPAALRLTCAVAECSRTSFDRQLFAFSRAWAGGIHMPICLRKHVSPRLVHTNSCTGPVIQEDNRPLQFLEISIVM